MVESIIVQIAERLAGLVVGAGVRRLQRRLSQEILGTPAERAMRGVYSRAIASMLIEMKGYAEREGDADALDDNHLKVAETLLEGLFSDEEAAGDLLEITLRPELVPVDALRYRFVRLGYDPETLPFSFDRAMVVLAEKLYDEFVSEVWKDNSPVQPLVNKGLLSTVRTHHAVLRELVLRVPQLGLTPEEALLQSKARCAVRWEALGIRREEAVALAADLEIGVPPSGFWTELELGDRSGHVSVLTAELGAGKSLMLDRIHQRALTRFDGTSRSPVPVFLRARDITGALREAVLTKAGPMGDASLRGCLLCLDGAEEAGYSRAVELLEESRELTHAWPNTTVVITSRPMSGFGSEQELVQVPLLSKDEAEKLANRFWSAGMPVSFPRNWPESLRDAVRRPLFAILVSLDRTQESGNWHRPRSIGELLSRLVQRALDRTNHEAAEEQLQQLAVLATDRGGGSVETAEVANPWQAKSLRRSGLVVEDGRSGTLAFSLPILEEWFAAQALASGSVDPELLAADPSRLERWRYPLAIAVGSLGHGPASQILVPLAKHAPANAARAVTEGLTEYGRSEATARLSVNECVLRIREAMGAWVEGIGPLAGLIAPVKGSSRMPAWECEPPEAFPRSDFSLSPLGVYTYRGKPVVVGWYWGEKDLPEVISIPRVVPSDADYLKAGWEWPRLHRNFGPGRQPAWAWRFTLDELTKELSEILNKRKLPIDDKLLLAKEHAWLTARGLLKLHGTHRNPIALADIESCLNTFGWDSDRIALDQPGTRQVKHYYPRYLKAEIQRLRDSGETEMQAPWPVNDKRSGDSEVKGTGPEGNVMVWDLYSPERLLERARVILEGMLEGYQWIVQRYFPRLMRAMPTGITLPARIEGVLVPRFVNKYTNGEPVLQWYLEPLPRGSESTIALSLTDSPVDVTDPGSPGLPFDDRKHILGVLDRLRNLRPEAADWLSPVLYSESMMSSWLFSKEPISELTYNMLWNDLKRVFWVQGRF